MSRTCSLCSREDRDQIDEAIRRGDSYRSIALHFDTSHATVKRHSAHVVRSLAKGSPPTKLEIDTSHDYLADLHQIRGKIANLLKEAENQENIGASIALSKELFTMTEKLIKIQMEQRKFMAEFPHLLPLSGSLFDHPAWQDMRRRIFKALADFPEARARLDRFISNDLSEEERKIFEEDLSPAVRDIIDRELGLNETESPTVETVPNIPEESVKSVAMHYRCLREHSWHGRLWHVGQVWDGSDPDSPEPPEGSSDWELFNSQEEQYGGLMESIR